MSCPILDPERLSSSSELLPVPVVDRVVSTAARTGMGRVLVLFVAGHRPLALVAGEMLRLVVPVASLVGMGFLVDWAALLSHVDGPAYLEQRLAHELDPHD